MSYSYQPFSIPSIGQMGPVAGVTTLLRVAANRVFGSPINTGSSNLSQMNSYRQAGLTRAVVGYAGKRRKVAAGQRKLATVAAVNRIINGTLEKKQLSIAPPVGFSFAQAADVNFNLTSKIVQGSGDGQRVGDAIHLNSLDVAVSFYTDPKAAYYRFRLIFYWSGEEYLAATTTWSVAGMTAAQLFVAPISAQGTVAMLNTKAVTVLHDSLYDVNSYINQYEDGVTTKFTIPLNQKYVYESAGGTFGKTKNLYCYITGNWASTNASLPTNVGSINANFLLKYTDA